MKYKCMKNGCSKDTDYFFEYYSPKEDRMMFVTLCREHQNQLGMLLSDFLDMATLMYWDAGKLKVECGKYGRTDD